MWCTQSLKPSTIRLLVTELTSSICKYRWLKRKQITSLSGWYTRGCFPTWSGLLRFTSHLSNSVAIAITAVVDAMNGLVPRLSDLVERPGLWLLTLIYVETRGKQKTWSDTTEKGSVLFRSWQVLLHFNSPTDELMLTDGVALPAPTSLSIAGAVHHVAIAVAFGEFLVYLIVQAINNALIWTQNEREKSATQNVHALFYNSNCFKTTSEVFFLLSDLAAVSTQRSSTPHGRCRDMCTPSCDPWFHGVCPTCLPHDALIHRWWYTTPHGLQKEIENEEIKKQKVLVGASVHSHAAVCGLTGNSPWSS